MTNQVRTIIAFADTDQMYDWVCEQYIKLLDLAELATSEGLEKTIKAVGRCLDIFDSTGRVDYLEYAVRYATGL